MRILCFGDSLTVGMTSSLSHPYSAVLSKLLPKHDILNEGMGGDMVSEMGRRLDNFLADKRAKHRQAIDAVVLWGGTNDVRLGVPHDQVKAGIEECLMSCAKNEVKSIIVVTLPEMSFEMAGNGTMRDNRIKVNESILKGGLNGATYTPADVESVLGKMFTDDGTINEDQKKEFWSDGLHLTKKGYATVGQLIYEKLKA